MGLTAVLSFERIPVLDSSRKRGTSHCFKKLIPSFFSLSLFLFSPLSSPVLIFLSYEVLTVFMFQCGIQKKCGCRFDVNTVVNSVSIDWWYVTNLSLFYDAVSILLRISSAANRNSLRFSGILPIVSSTLKGLPKTIFIQCFRVSKSIIFPPILFIDPSRLDSILRVQSIYCF